MLFKSSCDIACILASENPMLSNNPNTFNQPISSSLTYVDTEFISILVKMFLEPMAKLTIIKINAAPAVRINQMRRRDFKDWEKRGFEMNSFLFLFATCSIVFSSFHMF